MVLIPTLTNESSLLLTGMCLAISGMTWGLKIETGRRLPAMTVAATVVIGLVGALGCQHSLRPRKGLGQEIARYQSGHSLLLVMEDEKAGLRYLVDDFVLQNCYSPKDRQSCASFTHALQALAHAYSEAPVNVLCVGLGGGVVPMRFSERGANVEAVEIHPGMIKLAEEWFDFDSGLVQVWLEDGRGFLRRREKAYDVVLLDAFSGDSSPSHLLTREAFEDAKRALRGNGILVLNCIASTAPGADYLLASVQRTMGSVFDQVRIHFSPGGNVFLVASEGRLACDAERGLAACGAAFKERVEKTLLSYETELRAGGQLLTDDWNPVEFHDARWRAKEREKLAWMMYRK